MAHDPHTTTLATATDTSACVAAIAGASADTAVTPHMDVPAANRNQASDATQRISQSSV